MFLGASALATVGLKARLDKSPGNVDFSLLLSSLLFPNLTAVTSLFAFVRISTVHLIFQSCSLYSWYLVMLVRLLEGQPLSVTVVFATSG